MFWLTFVYTNDKRYYNDETTSSKDVLIYFLITLFMYVYTGTQKNTKIKSCLPVRDVNILYIHHTYMTSKLERYFCLSAW